MEVHSLPLNQLRAAPWNPNSMTMDMLSRLRESLTRFGVVTNLVVRPVGADAYETLGGNQRLQVLRELGYQEAPCVVVEANDIQARLLSQALNRVQGTDDLGLRAELLREVLQALPQEDVLALLPESAGSLAALTSLGQETMAQHLQAWQQAQGARLKHLAFQLLPSQQEVIEEALARMMPQPRESQGDSPNRRGTCLFLLCQRYLELEVAP